MRGRRYKTGTPSAWSDGDKTQGLKTRKPVAKGTRVHRSRKRGMLQDEGAREVRDAARIRDRRD